MSKRAEQEWTWVRAIIVSVIISGLLIVFLGFIPSIIRYTWENQTDNIAAFVQQTTGYEFKDRYTLVRIHDIISMGLQTVFFAIPLIAAYKIGERRRRRLGLRGTEGVKGYLPGK
ncbi:MAG: hypothetical protein M3164_00350 [Actinomycetota bacterium]|nr:hypothetical protein [Actinomycetota bacterium]